MVFSIINGPPCEQGNTKFNTKILRQALEILYQYKFQVETCRSACLFFKFTSTSPPSVIAQSRLAVQLNKFETGPYFLQDFQCRTMFISTYCKICELNTELESEPEIVQKKLQLTFRLTPLKSAEKTLSHSVLSSEILQYVEINIVMHWKFCRKYRPVSHLFSCTTFKYLLQK